DLLLHSARACRSFEVTGARTMKLDLSPLERAVAQLDTFYDLSLQPQEREVMAEALRMAAIQAFEYSYEFSVKMLRRYLEMTEPNPNALDDASFQNLIR